jgi:hypothetical protein
LRPGLFQNLCEVVRDLSARLGQASQREGRLAYQA